MSEQTPVPEMLQSLFRALGLGALTGTRPQELDVSLSYELVTKRQALLVDVREANEWQSTGLPLHAHPVALSDPYLVSKVSELVEHHVDQPVLISCLSGKRAAKAIEILQKANVNNLHLVTGGFQAWQANGLPLQEYAAD